MWQQPYLLELGGLEQFKALSTYWDLLCGAGLGGGGLEASGQPRCWFQAHQCLAPSPVSHHPAPLCQSNGRHRGFWGKNNQPRTSVLESHLFIQQLFTRFTPVRCVLLRLPLGEATSRGGQGVYCPPPPDALERGESFATLTARCVSSSPAFT